MRGASTAQVCTFCVLWWVNLFVVFLSCDAFQQKASKQQSPGIHLRLMTQHLDSQQCLQPGSQQACDRAWQSNVSRYTAFSSSRVQEQLSRALGSQYVVVCSSNSSMNPMPLQLQYCWPMQHSASLPVPSSTIQSYRSCVLSLASRNSCQGPWAANMLLYVVATAV